MQISDLDRLLTTYHSTHTREMKPSTAPVPLRSLAHALHTSWTDKHEISDDEAAEDVSEDDSVGDDDDALSVNDGELSEDESIDDDDDANEDAGEDEDCELEDCADA